MLRLPPMLVAAALASAASAQVTWAWLQPPQSPLARYAHSLTYDRSRGCAVLFGGRDAGLRALADTWEWDGSDWHPRASAFAPAPRFSHAMAFDIVRQRTVLYGGVGANGVLLGDTLEWDGVRWDPRPGIGPSARADAALAFDRARGRIVLFGGQGSLGVHDDTWEWDGTRWLPRVVPGPSARSAAAQAFDAARGRLLLFGGVDGFGASLDDTWEWDGTRWALLTPAVRPPARRWHALVFDDARARVVLFGGFDPPLRFLADTWEWDGTGWQQRTPLSAPGLRAQVGCAYDARRARVLAFGGFWPGALGSDTWEYFTTLPASFTRFGAGCAGTAGTPALDVQPWSLPWLGDVLRLDVTVLPNGAPAALACGTSRAWLGSTPLPLDLSGFGMPGCSLLVSTDLWLPLQIGSGSATLAMPLPAIPALAGGQLHAQGFAADPLANPAGVIASQAGTAVLGLR